MRTSIFISSLFIAGSLGNPKNVSTQMVFLIFFLFAAFLVWDVLSDNFKPKLIIKDKTDKIVGSISEG